MPRKGNYSGAASDERMHECESLAESVAAIFASDGGIGSIVLPRAAVLLEKRSRRIGRGAIDERMRQVEQLSQAVADVFADDVDIAPIALRRAAILLESKTHGPRLTKS